MGKPKAPATPDYAGAAVKQGEANLNSALATNYLNQQNQVGPYGSMTYNYSTPGNGGQYLPDGTYIPTATVETKLSPQEQALYDQTNQISQALNSTALRGLDYADQVTRTPITDAGMPRLQSSVGLPNMEMVGGTPTFRTGFQGQQLQTNVGDTPTYQQYNRNYIGTAGLQSDVSNPGQATSYDFSNLGAMPSSNDFGAQRDQITDALMQRLQPYIDRDRDRLNTRLVNQGLNQGAKAYEADQEIFNRGVNDQRIAALLAGSGEQQRLFQNAMGIRQQGMGEAVAQGNFGNTAKQNMFNMGLASGQFRNEALQQELLNRNTALDAINRTTGMDNDLASRRFEDNLTKMGAENAAKAGQFGMDAAQADFYNTATAQQRADEMARVQTNNQTGQSIFNMGLAGGQFANQARSQAIQEQDYFRNAPINLINALRSGNQMTMPQFQNWAGGAGVQAAPVYAAVNDQYNAQLEAYKQKMAGFSATMGGLGKLGGAAINKWG